MDRSLFLLICSGVDFGSVLKPTLDVAWRKPERMLVRVMTIDIEPDAVNFGLGPILHTCLPEVPWTSAHTNRLPGITPMKDSDWLRVDHTYARQMALRDILAAARPEEVTACWPRAKDAAQELLATVIDDLCERGEFVLDGNAVRRPDGVVVNIGEPMPTLLRLVSEDLCILAKEDGNMFWSRRHLGFRQVGRLLRKSASR